MEPENGREDSGAESEGGETPLLPKPSGHARWLTFAAFLVAAALAFWRCG